MLEFGEYVEELLATVARSPRPPSLPWMIVFVCAALILRSPEPSTAGRSLLPEAGED